MKNTCLLILFFAPFILSAQKNFKPGYIVSMQGDTSLGMIDYKEWNFTPTRILFKPSDDNAPAKEFGINDLRFFSINGYEAYMRSVVKLSLNPIKMEDVGARDTSWRLDTVFLKVIQMGRLASLMSYSDKLKERFYLLEQGAHQPTELILRKHVRDDAFSIVTEFIYKEQLKRLVYVKGVSTDKIIGRIEKAEYEEYDLKKVMALINNSGTEDVAEEKGKRHAYWFAGAGVQRSQVEFTGNHQFAKNDARNESAWLPRISAGVDLFVNPDVGKMFYRVEAGYQLNNSTVTVALPDNVKAIYNLSGGTASVQAQINYSVYKTDKLKIPLGIGVIHGQHSYSKNEYKKRYVDGSENNYVKDWLLLKKSTTTYFGRAALVFNNKIEASFSYRPFTKLTKTVAYSLASNNMQFQVYYLLRQGK